MSARPQLVLASTSPHRRALLERLRLPFAAMPPQCDEDAARALGLPPRRLAGHLARAKADAVAERHRGAVVIGSDQVCALDGEVLGKPGSREGAIAQLLRLAGRTHELYTAVCVRCGDRRIEFTDTSRLTLRPLSPAVAARYVDADLPFDCAGSYKLEALGIALMQRVQSDDHTAITGLPLIGLCAALRELGIEV